MTSGTDPAPAAPLARLPALRAARGLPWATLRTSGSPSTSLERMKATPPSVRESVG